MASPKMLLEDTSKAFPTALSSVAAFFSSSTAEYSLVVVLLEEEEKVLVVRDAGGANASVLTASNVAANQILLKYMVVYSFRLTLFYDLFASIV